MCERHLRRPICDMTHSYLTVPICDVWEASLSLFKELIQKSPVYVKRDLYTFKVTCIHHARLTKQCNFLDICVTPEVLDTQRARGIFVCVQETYTKESRIHPKKPIYIRRDLYTSKETYIHQKRRVDIKIDQEKCTHSRKQFVVKFTDFVVWQRWVDSLHCENFSYQRALFL